ncbi:MAG: citrate lyase holo-[Bacteroidales bacterium]|nr:citrate lyase holo-[acyl-carrier protein] synthase [Bacteroidales bacterium]
MERITLETLLRSRDRRAGHQQKLLQAYPGLTLLCVTVVMPGPVKRTEGTLVIGRAAMAALRKEQDLLYEETDDLETGFEGYAVTALPSVEAKRLAVRLEETHPLGRLFDIDVIRPDGEPMPREAVGSGPRKCLLCDRDARFCMRNHTHSYQELLSKIDELLGFYAKS